MQPAGYIHSQGFLDPARYTRHQLRKFGADVSIGKNRLREDSINIIFGAHLGFPEYLRQRYACVFFNLEQIGEGGATLDESYLALLSSSPVIDYDENNLPGYGGHAGNVSIASFKHAPYLNSEPSLPLSERPIDLLFFGSVNARRESLINRINETGWQVARFDHPIYSDERDDFIRQSKAVLNCHFYESGRFEQIRAFQTLSLKTPVISGRSDNTSPPVHFEECVTWLCEDKALEDFFRTDFMTPKWQARAQQQIRRFEENTSGDSDWEHVLKTCESFNKHAKFRKSCQAWRPKNINLGSGKDYKTGWLNIDILDSSQPDLKLDLSQKIEFPLTAKGLDGSSITLEAGCVEKIYANNVLEHVPDLPCLMTNLLTLLTDGGDLEIEVPYEKSITAWQDPTHVRALNENSWLYYTGWFWYLGWFNHRFEMKSLTWLDIDLTPCEKSSAAFMRVALKKMTTTPRERSIARTMRPDFCLSSDAQNINHAGGEKSQSLMLTNLLA